MKHRCYKKTAKRILEIVCSHFCPRSKSTVSNIKKVKFVDDICQGDMDFVSIVIRSENEKIILAFRRIGQGKFLLIGHPDTREELMKLHNEIKLRFARFGLEFETRLISKNLEQYELELNNLYNIDTRVKV